MMDTGFESNSTQSTELEQDLDIKEEFSEIPLKCVEFPLPPMNVAQV